MILSIIVAVAENGAIGKDNALLWHLPADMKFFKEKTNGHFIITGRKNYESIPDKFRPLPGRTNLVITRSRNYHAPGAVVVHSIEDALFFARQHSDKEEVFIIGGAEIYRQTLGVCQRVYLTRVHHAFEADAFFEGLDNKTWKMVNEEKHPADEKNKFAFDLQTWELTGQ